jgi:hypothetical protein
LVLRQVQFVFNGLLPLDQLRQAGGILEWRVDLGLRVSANGFITANSSANSAARADPWPV